MYTLSDEIKSIENEIAYQWSEVRYEEALTKIKAKEIIQKIKDLKVARHRLKVILQTSL